MGWMVSGKQIQSPSGTVVKFNFEVGETVAIGNLLIVVLQVPPECVMTENVFALSNEGRILWQISPYSGTGTNLVNCYVGVLGSDDRTIQIANWNGEVVSVDIGTGNVIASRFGK